VRRLGTKPLIVWSLDVVIGIIEICDILVSTDDVEIARIAVAAGAMVPWLRPAELASDMATSLDACVHALDWYEKEKGSVDGVLLLQPTSPFRRRTSVLRGIDLFRDSRLFSVVGVSPAKSHPLWCFRIVDGTLRPFIGGAGLNARSQDLPPAYVINGAFYLSSPKALRDRHSFFSDDMVPLVMSEPEEAIDIDSEWDWKMAQAALSVLEGD
jgi:CMP-N,N'-diacetyllegionaminic acid synthase